MPGSDDAMGETLVVRCKRCRRVFSTPLQVDRASLEAMVLTEVYRCPWCDGEATYVKGDHFHQLIETENTG